MFEQCYRTPPSKQGVFDAINPIFIKNFYQNPPVYRTETPHSSFVAPSRASALHPFRIRACAFAGEKGAWSIALACLARSSRAHTPYTP